MIDLQNVKGKHFTWVIFTTCYHGIICKNKNEQQKKNIHTTIYVSNWPANICILNGFLKTLSSVTNTKILEYKCIDSFKHTEVLI